MLFTIFIIAYPVIRKPTLPGVSLSPHGAQGLKLEIENPGEYGGPRAGGQGLAMVQRRLELSYGDQASLEIAGVAGERTRVTLILPGAPQRGGER